MKLPEGNRGRLFQTAVPENVEPSQDTLGESQTAGGIPIGRGISDSLGEHEFNQNLLRSDVEPSCPEITMSPNVETQQIETQSQPGEIVSYSPEISLVAHMARGFSVMFRYLCECGKHHDGHARNVWPDGDTNTTTVTVVCPSDGHSAEVSLERPS